MGPTDQLNQMGTWDTLDRTDLSDLFEPLELENGLFGLKGLIVLNAQRILWTTSTESIRPNRFIGQIVYNTDQLDPYDLLNLMGPLDLDSADPLNLMAPNGPNEPIC